MDAVLLSGSISGSGINENKIEIHKYIHHHIRLFLHPIDCFYIPIPSDRSFPSILLIYPQWISHILFNSSVRPHILFYPSSVFLYPIRLYICPSTVSIHSFPFVRSSINTYSSPYRARLVSTLVRGAPCPGPLASRSE